MKKVTLIKAGAQSRQYWRDIWDYRELMLFFAWRDIIVRYKQTILGISWSVFRPIINTIVFTIIFGKLAMLPSVGAAPYALTVLAALLPWQFFANAIGSVSGSILGSGSLITKVYFPRLIIPISSLAASLLDLIITSAIFIVIMAWYHYIPPLRIFLLPVFLALAITLTMGAGIWLSALTVKFRDFRAIVPVMVQLGFFICPVGFSSAIIPEKWKLIYSLNPMVAVIDGCRWCIIEGAPIPSLQSLLLGLSGILCILLGGVLYFRATENNFADVI